MGNRVYEIFEKLVISIQALGTMGKLRNIKGYVGLTLENLPGMRAGLMKLDKD